MVVVVLVAGPGSVLAAPPKLAVVPPEVTGVEGAAADELRDELMSQVAQLQLQLASSMQVRGVLTRSDKGCASQKPCLQRLAKEVGAGWALAAQVTVESVQLVAKATVVSDAGVLARQVPGLTVPFDLSQPRPPQLRALVQRLIYALELESLGEVPVKLTPPEPPRPVAPAPPPVAVVEPVAPPPTPTPDPVVAPSVPVAEVRRESGGFGLRHVSYLLGGTSLVVGAIGAGFAGSAAADAGELNKSLVNGLLPRSQVANARALDQKSAVATGLLVGAGVGLVAAVVLFIVSPDEPAPVSLWLARDGGGLVVRHDF